MLQVQGLPIPFNNTAPSFFERAHFPTSTTMTTVASSTTTTTTTTSTNNADNFINHDPLPRIRAADICDTSQLSPDEAYLSYHDIRLTRQDVDAIKNDWLTDNAIAFWEEFLEREKLTHYPKANIVLLRPSMSFMLQNTRDPLSLKDALPDFAKTTHVFLPINDCSRVDIAEGGSHWSLLLVSVIDGVAFHYDSLNNSNFNQGKLVGHKISQLLGKPLRFINLEDTPQQDNGMDCGVYVCLLMQHLLIQKLLRAHAQEKVTMSMRGKEVDARGGRKAMLRVIEARRKEGERRRSRSHSPYSQSKSNSPPRVGTENENL